MISLYVMSRFQLLIRDDNKRCPTFETFDFQEVLSVFYEMLQETQNCDIVILFGQKYSDKKLIGRLGFTKNTACFDTIYVVYWNKLK